MSGYTFREFSIPEHMLEGLVAWIEHGVPPGDFLRAVLCNNLVEAVGRADDTNISNLPAYVAYLYNYAPRGCWGSPENVAVWQEAHASRRAHAAAAAR